MPQQPPQRTRPFVPKETFDQVSAAMWGRHALDYDANYILTRTHWTDAEIREEALYFAGLARGLRLGAAQIPRGHGMLPGSAQVRLGDFIREENYHPGNIQPCRDPAFKQGSSMEGFRPQFFGIAQENISRPAAPAQRASESAGGSPHSTVDTYALAPNGISSGRNFDEHVQIRDSHDATTPWESKEIEAPLGLYESYPPLPATRFTGAQQAVNSAAVKGTGQEVMEPFGILSAPDEKMRSIPLTNDQMSHARDLASRSRREPRAPEAVPGRDEVFEPTQEGFQCLEDIDGFGYHY